MDIQIKGEDFGSFHKMEKPKPDRWWMCKCAGQRPRPPYFVNCPDCWARRPY